jgi:hypothetical protein
VAYTKDTQGSCRKCGKKTQFVRCPSCKGKGGGMTTQCSNCDNTGYKCENGVSDRGHR